MVSNCEPRILKDSTARFFHSGGSSLWRDTAIVRPSAQSASLGKIAHSIGATEDFLHQPDKVNSLQEIGAPYATTDALARNRDCALRLMGCRSGDCFFFRSNVAYLPTRTCIGGIIDCPRHATLSL